ncbi:MAG: hypothetical protein HRU33_00605 [Rhodobacteraceae bacterium]|nr:hypothetical protein [Paracoccaceae bacterium]
MMQPSEGDLTTWLETKFNPMVEANEGQQEVLAGSPRSRFAVMRHTICLNCIAVFET